jgi:hypothetical protein
VAIRLNLLLVGLVRAVTFHSAAGEFINLTLPLKAITWQPATVNPINSYTSVVQIMAAVPDIKEVFSGYQTLFSPQNSMRAVRTD